MVKKVFGANILVKQLEFEETTQSGLIVVPTRKGQKRNIGEVKMVGEGHITTSGEIVPLPVKEGDLVMFQPYAGTVINDGDEDYLLINAKDLLLEVA